MTRYERLCSNPRRRANSSTRSRQVWSPVFARPTNRGANLDEFARAATAARIIAHRHVDLTTANRNAFGRYRMTDGRPSLFDPRLDNLAQNVQQKLVCLLNPRSGIAPHQE